MQFQSIAEQADGVILSLGNLALDMQPEKLALIQRAITVKCNMIGKPVLVTRVLDSMVESPQAHRQAVRQVLMPLYQQCAAHCYVSASRVPYLNLCTPTEIYFTNCFVEELSPMQFTIHAPRLLC